MSHVRNVDSYSRLVTICAGHEGNYKPGNGNLQLKAMRALLEKAQSSLQDVSLKRNLLSEIINERNRAYAYLHVLVSKIIRTLQANQAGDDTLANARYYSRLINGNLKLRKSREPVTTEEAETVPVVTRSMTQQSYVAKAHNFMQLVDMISRLTQYSTQSEELKPEALQEMATRLTKLNEAWTQAKVDLKNARISRNAVLYNGKDALLDNGMAAKNYLRAEFDSSEERERLKSVSFTKIKLR